MVWIRFLSGQGISADLPHPYLRSAALWGPLFWAKAATQLWPGRAGLRVRPGPGPDSPFTSHGIEFRFGLKLQAAAGAGARMGRGPLSVRARGCAASSSAKRTGVDSAAEIPWGKLRRTYGAPSSSIPQHRLPAARCIPPAGGGCHRDCPQFGPTPATPLSATSLLEAGALREEIVLPIALTAARLAGWCADHGQPVWGCLAEGVCQGCLATPTGPGYHVSRPGVGVKPCHVRRPPPSLHAQ